MDSIRTGLLRQALAILCLVGCLAPLPAAAEWVWIEGEKPGQSDMARHPWWYDQVKREALSGGDFISNFSKDHVGTAEYAFSASSGGAYEFWVRANPVAARLSYRLNGGQWTAIGLEHGQAGSANIAADGKIDLRFIAWIKVGQVTLKKGANAIAFRMDSANSNHGFLDCFVFSTEPFKPSGVLKPDQIAAHIQEMEGQNKGYFAFDPKADPFQSTPVDLRFLNEKAAGESGFVTVKDGHFILGRSGKCVRFWAVNGPPEEAKGRPALRQTARMLAKHGVNMVRVHHGYFDADGQVRPTEVLRTIETVEEMKAEGIYSHLSVYFPLWLAPKPNTPWLDGYDGQKKPFAALYFNEAFQKVYRTWWKALLTTPSPATGKRLVDEPALASVELINEDSFLFWTFHPDNIPDPQLRILEGRFGAWLAGRFGSIGAAAARWKGVATPRDNPADGRMGFRPLWNLFNEKTLRDQDTAAFLVEVQRGFYRDTSKYLRGLGFKGLITASNWVTASPQVLGPLEKYTYTVGDFIDRHGYFGCNQKGDSAEWSVRDGHTYSDRSALRFDPEEPGKGRQFVHPVMDVRYDHMPSMISETTFCRPNRYRSEAPLYYAAYGSLQDSNALVHFALDTSRWTVKPGFFMQPWTLMSPAMMGQFPAAAVIFRQGLVATGEVLAEVDLQVADLLALKGTPLPQDASFDELRLKDVPLGTTLKPGGVIDPLIHYAGRTATNFTDRPSACRLQDLRRYVDRAGRTVSSTTGQLKLDYGKGVLTINAPAAQGVSGALSAAGNVQLKDLAVESGLELGHIVAVSLDGLPLARSGKILLQAMSEERNGNFATEPAGQNVLRITSIGQDPWMVKELSGTVRFRRADAARLTVTALDLNGYPARELGSAREIQLDPRTLYYLIAAQ